MIKVDVEEYCQQCLDFTPDVLRPERIVQETLKGNRTEIYSDTIIQCKHRKRCAGITRYLEHQVKGKTSNER